MRGEGTEPTYVIECREALTPMVAELDQYEATTQFKRTGDCRSQPWPRHRRELRAPASIHLPPMVKAAIMIASLRYLGQLHQDRGVLVP